jgi:hypothetical protein
MGIDGIWKIEMLGAYGWESVSTAFLKEGRHWDGSADHYALGRYSLDGDRVTSEVSVVVHGSSRALFGKTAKRYDLRFKGEWTEDRISGVATDEEGRFLLRYRATKLAELT